MYTKVYISVYTNKCIFPYSGYVLEERIPARTSTWIYTHMYIRMYVYGISEIIYFIQSPKDWKKSVVPTTCIFLLSKFQLELFKRLNTDNSSEINT